MLSNSTFQRCLSILKAWGPAVAWMCLIFTASADRQSVAHSSRIIEPLCRWLFPAITHAQLETVQLVTRKGAHMSEYALLALLLLHALSYGRGEARRWMSSAWMLAVSYAGADEFHQLFVPGRDGRFTDVLIDASGAALGLLACYGVLRLLDSRKTTTAPEMPPATAPVRRPSFADQVLCTLHGEDFETRCEVRLAVQDRLQRENGGRLILGRNPAAAQLLVQNTSVSGQHLALIVHAASHFEVEDLDSSNGTKLNGRRLPPFQPAALADNDRIEAGELLLHFRRNS